jgi:outer membrane protein
MRTLLLTGLMVAGAVPGLRADPATAASPISYVVPAPAPPPVAAPYAPARAPGLLPVPESLAPLPVESAPAWPPTTLRRSSGVGLHFTLREAESYALANHPQIAGARLTAESVRQEIVEARSQFFPQVYLESDSAYAPPGARLAASGGLNNPSVFSRQSDGATLSQLLFDFGQTFELTEAAHFRANAASDRLNTARATVLLQVDQAYFGLLRAEAIARVAAQTVHERQLSFNQISVLTRNQLKSSLDADFAQVDLSEAKLLEIQGASDVANAESSLSTAMGFSDAQHFVLQDVPLDAALPASPDGLVEQAIAQRPELAALRSEQGAADRFARSQEAARYPKITALAAAGVSPVSDTANVKRTYYAAGINVTAPIFTGGDLRAQAQEAKLLADAAVDNLVDAQNTITRDVRIAWENAQTAEERLEVTSQLITTANEEETLANARYRLGTSSIVEFVQAQLNATQARLQDASARYDYLIGRSLLDFTVGRDEVTGFQ